MSKRKRYYTLSEEIGQGVACIKCHLGKGKYEEMIELGSYFEVKFKCTRCHRSISHYWPKEKVKEYLAKESRDK